MKYPKSASTFIFSKRNKTPVIAAVMSIIILVGLTGKAFSQDGLPKGVVPPPLGLISKDEKKALEAESKLSGRTKVALTLMNTRLTRAENQTKNNEFQKSLNNLGSFQAILRDTLSHLKKNEKYKGSLKSFKRFEISLRKTIPRLELIRRGTPYKYGYHVRRLIRTVRDARRKAIDPLFADTVIPEGSRT